MSFNGLKLCLILLLLPVNSMYRFLWIVNMVFIFAIGILFFSCGLINCELCGSCFCKPPVAVCYINSCNTALVKYPEIEIIQIHGQLCANHISDLKDLFYYNTIVELVDSVCVGDISNCR